MSNISLQNAEVFEINKGHYSNHVQYANLVVADDVFPVALGSFCRVAGERFISFSVPGRYPSLFSFSFGLLAGDFSPGFSRIQSSVGNQESNLLPPANMAPAVWSNMVPAVRSNMAPAPPPPSLERNAPRIPSRWNVKRHPLTEYEGWELNSRKSNYYVSLNDPIWWDDKGTFQAGDTATIKVKVLENKIDKKVFNPTLTVNGKEGNSSYVSTVLSDFERDPNEWKIFFTPIKVGLFNVLISEERYKVDDSSLHFQVEPGNMYPSVCVASWKGVRHEYEAGSKATLMVLLKDAFGNGISKTTQVSYLPDFKLSVLHENGSVASAPDIFNMGWTEFDYIVIEFIVTKAGKFSLSLEGGNQTLKGSPLPLKLDLSLTKLPGAIDVSNCIAKWNVESHAWQLSSKMEIFIHQLDKYGNLVSGLYPFDSEVVETDTNLSIPISDLHFQEVDAGIQFVVNGSGLNDSVAGVKEEFSVYLNDIYQYPSPVQANILQPHPGADNGADNGAPARRDSGEQTDRSQLPLFAFSWWDDKGTFQAGDTATIKVKVLENAYEFGWWDDKGTFQAGDTATIKVKVLGKTIPGLTMVYYLNDSVHLSMT
ncbi:hypothetical protein V8G54_037575 [Vigna mungo]|uniref:GEX2 N-terminal Ig-like domain-containing protein n=1 Tax=Vigna mungo TaxID=3915 RepID=A0AAQ3MJE4_VIGMU